MAIAGGNSGSNKLYVEGGDGKLWRLCKMPFWQSGSGSSSSNSSTQGLSQFSSRGRSGMGIGVGGSIASSSQRQGSGGSVSSLARSLLPVSRRLQLDPADKLYFPCLFSVLAFKLRGVLIWKRLLVRSGCVRLYTLQYPNEPGKQVRSAVRIKNISKSHVAFKFQTTAPKSCFMRPPGCVLSPGESIIATVFKFVEHPENNEKQFDQKCKVKFKIICLKVDGPMEYVPELFEEHKNKIAVEQILRVVFLDPDRLSPQMDKLKRLLAEAEAALEARRKPPEDTGPRIVGEGLVIDEWKERRERYLARQQVGVDSV